VPAGFDEPELEEPDETFDDGRPAVTPAPTVSVGKYCERASLTMARAARKFAKAAATFWFEMSTLSSREFSSGSLYTSHHLPRIEASLGCACFQMPASVEVSGVISL
jgi:hypothetical protein